ncbi:YfcC family protein [Leucobacter triazinivorans]|uniref:YfcC family protein n=1 Tax=Leucobacter triazinivorans TaxID=1784719 RepID=A0A4P6KGZ5_9MICO|nr:Na+/H+ antiporter NhaC family protein [Leucobacter triazinivorans]QBE49706.1 YfcC family protein [Leucobacter triazinivorans]
MTVNAADTAESSPKPGIRSRLRIPHTYAIILSIVILMGVLSYVVPSGEFERADVDGRLMVVPDTFQTIAKTLISPFDIVTAIPRGMQEAAQIVFYIFLVGGAFGVIRATGAIDAGINRLVQKIGRSQKFIIPLVMIVFSVLGFTTGMAEECIIFVPIGIGIALSLGYDAIVGTAMVATGAAAGFIGGMMNPFTVGVAQGIAEVPLFSGFWFRAAVYVPILAVAIVFVMRYAARVKNDPSTSILYGRVGAVGSTDYAVSETIPELTRRRALVLLMLAVGIGINMWGVFNWGWFLDQLAASFFIIGMLSGLVGKLGVNGSFTSLVEGMRSVVFGALVVGFARAILVVMQDGQTLDTIINFIASGISDWPPVFTVLGMFVFQSILNFFIPSGSGMAATTMPLMVPLSDLLGIDRQVAVLAFQYGDAITNSIIPTSGALMGYLAVARIPYELWFKFIWKLIVMWMVIAAIALMIGAAFGVPS